MRTLLKALLVSVLLAGVLVVAEARDQAPSTPSPAPPNTAAPAAPGPQASLQAMADEVAPEVERLRGWTFRVPVRRERVGPEGVRRYVESQLAVALPPARRPLVEAFLKTAGLIPPDCDPVSTVLKLMDQQVAGFYDPPTGTLFLVDRTNPMPPFMQRGVLAHELAHALDDQHVGIRALADPAHLRTEDASIVLASLGEGSATSLMLQFMVREMTAGKVNPGEMGAYFARELEQAKALAQTPPYFNAMFGSYVIGAAFLARGDLQSVLRLPDNRSVGESFRAAWAKPPRSSEQVLHPEKYWEDGQRDEPVEIDDAAVRRWLDRPGRHVVHIDTLGELLTATLTTAHDEARDFSRMMMSPGEWTNAAASGWGGDRFYLVAAGGTRAEAESGLRQLQGVWVTAWDEGRDRAEFLTAIERGSIPRGAFAAPSGDRVAIVFIGFEPAERDDLLRRLEKTPLTMTRSGTRWE